MERIGFRFILLVVAKACFQPFIFLIPRLTVCFLVQPVLSLCNFMSVLSIADREVDTKDVQRKPDSYSILPKRTSAILGKYFVQTRNICVCLTLFNVD